MAIEKVRKYFEKYGIEDRILELTEERDTLLNNQPKLIYTAPKDVTCRIKLKENERIDDLEFKNLKIIQNQQHNL